MSKQKKGVLTQATEHLKIEPAASHGMYPELVLL